MDSGVIELTELNQQLSLLESIEFRLALVRVADQWQAHTLILEHAPEHVRPETPSLNMDYGSVVFLSGRIPGKAATEWLYHREGSVTPPWLTGPVRRFALPPFGGKVNWQRFPSHAAYDYTRVPCPVTRYDVTGGSVDIPLRSDAFLLADGQPFFPNLQTAILKLIYEASDPGQFQNATLAPRVIVRIVENTAWLGEIHLSPTAITAKVHGTRVAGTQVTISGASSVQFQQQMQKRGSIECPLPNGIPSPLWIVLSRGNQWLDFYHRDAHWPIASQHQANVTVDVGDPAVEIAALIAQGEGLTTEFKAAIPDNHDQMLKTVAAFANGSGGVLLIGVHDESTELIDFSGKPDDITQMIRNTVFPDPVPHIELVEIERRRILVIRVPKGASPPYGLHEKNTRYYVRRGATTFEARPEEIRAIILASQPIGRSPFAGYVS